MNIFAKIDNLKNVTESEAIIIDFIKEYPIDFTNMDIDEMVDKCFVSKSSIYRLCNKLGYSGLNELKIMVTASIQEKLAYEEFEVDFNRPFIKKDSEFTVLSNLRNLYEQTVYLSSSHIDMIELHYSIYHLKNALKIILFIDEEYHYIAEIFKKRMQLLGVNIEVPENDTMKIAAAQNSKRDNVAIYATYFTKENKHQELIKLLNGNQTKIILLSPSDNEVLIKRATNYITIGRSEKSGPMIANFSTSVYFMFIFDIIYSLYFNKDYDKNIENINALYMKGKSMH